MSIQFGFIAFGLTATYSSDNPSNLSAARDGVEFTCDHVSTETKHDMNFLSGFTHDTEPNSDDYKGYMRDATLEIHDKGQLMHGDHVVLVDDLWGDGYGRAYPDNPIVADGNEYNVCRVTATNLISDRETRYMAFHELGHALDCSHGDGHYVIGEDYRGNIIPEEFTVMSTPYVRDTAGGNAHTGFIGGRSTPPSAFCGTDNYEVEMKGDNHLDAFSTCAISAVDSHLEGL